MLDLIKDHVHINNLALLENKSEVYDFDCIIPDSLPDMLKILAADAYADTEFVSKASGSAKAAVSSVNLIYPKAAPRI